MSFFSNLFKPIAAVRDILAGVLGSLGLHPNYLTIAAVPLAAGAAWFYWEGELLAAGLMILAVGMCDFIDGALARNFKWDSRFGTVLDASIDLYTEAILFGGIALYFMRVGDIGSVVTALLAMAGIMLSEYVRSRAERIVDKCKVGFMRRIERFTLLILCTLLAKPLLAVVLVAVFTHIDAVRRFLYTELLLRDNS